MKSIKETRDESGCEYYEFSSSSPAAKHVSLTSFCVGFNSGATAMRDKILGILRAEGTARATMLANKIESELKKEE